MVRDLIANRFNRFDILILLTIVLIGLVNLPLPFENDKALFTIGALKMKHGEILYRDFWDAKQPGIYGFFFIAGTLFGFNEIGIHAFELLYMIIFSIILILTLKGYFKNPSVASLVPLLTVGLYYGVSRGGHLTQVEALVGFPIFLSLWYASESSCTGGSRTLRLFLSGFMGGIVLLFKFMFLPILLAFWFTALIDNIVRKQDRIPATFLRIGAPIFMGVLLPVLIVFGYFAWHDLLNLLYWTFFVYPTKAVTVISVNRIEILMRELRWFFSNFAPLLALGSIGAYVSLSSRRDLITLNLVFWSILGFGVILLQRLSWWQYHYLLLFVPLGILGARGLDILWSQIKKVDLLIASWKGRAILVLSLLLLFSPVIGNLAKKSLFLAFDGFALNKEHRLKYQNRFSYGMYAKVLAEVAFLSERESFPGDIYVFGNPLYYLLSKRDQAIALNGWACLNYLPEQWAQLTEQLSKALPPYIFVGRSRPFNNIKNWSPKTAHFIEQNYQELRRSESGVWYILRENRQEHLRTNQDIHSTERSNYRLPHTSQVPE